MRNQRYLSTWSAGMRRPSPIDVAVEVIADTSPVVLPIWIRGVTGAVCGDLGYRYKVMTSGAGHDAQIVNSIASAGMILVPSRDGLSHVPEEWTSTSDVARGVDVLRTSVVRLDALLGSLEAIPAAAAD